MSRADLELSLLAKAAGYEVDVFGPNSWLQKRNKKGEIIKGKYIHNRKAKGLLYDREKPYVEEAKYSDLKKWFKSMGIHLSTFHKIGYGLKVYYVYSVDIIIGNTVTNYTIDSFVSEKEALYNGTYFCLKQILDD